MQPRKILFANVPFDGHYLPLTGIAVKLKELGHDVRWYTGDRFVEKIKNLGIQPYPFRQAKEVNQFNIDEVFPERKNLKAGVKQLKFDLVHLFVQRAPEYFADITEIKKEFDFDLMVADVAFTGAELVQKKLSVKVVSVSVMPLMTTSKDLPQYGLALLPNNSFTGRIRNSFTRFLAKEVMFKASTNEYNKIISQYGLAPHDLTLFDIAGRVADGFIQSGVPEFEYDRSDFPARLKFVGPLHAYRKEKKSEVNYEWTSKLGKYEKTILISQGTAESDHSKLIIPALEALKDSNYLLIVATGHLNTDSLRKKYQKDNIIIEDFVDFNFIMPRADVYVTNGGYGGTLAGIDHAIPMVAAGINEGKNEICARIGYFKLGINLNKEKPAPQEVKAAVDKVVSDPVYKNNVSKLRDQFRSHDAPTLSAEYILAVN